MLGDAGIEAPISFVLETVQLLKILRLSAAFAVAWAKSQDYEARIFQPSEIALQEQGWVGDGRVVPDRGKHW